MWIQKWKLKLGSTLPSSSCFFLYISSFHYHFQLSFFDNDDDDDRFFSSSRNADKLNLFSIFFLFQENLTKPNKNKQEKKVNHKGVCVCVNRILNEKK